MSGLTIKIYHDLALFWDFMGDFPWDFMDFIVA